MTNRSDRWPPYYTLVALLISAVFISYIDRTNISVGAIAMQAQFGWNETQKGMVLSAFFVGYLLLMLVSGALANRYGGKIILGIAVVWWSLFTVLTPPAALISLPALVLTRVALGVGEAAMFPAAMNLVNKWVPPLQRSRVVALIVSTISLATVFALPMTGWLVRSYGWPVPFYAFGALGLIWAVAWFGGVGERSAPRELVKKLAPPIPWKRLLRLPSVWAIIVANFCFNWSLFLLLAWMPSYLKTTFGISLANAGVYSAAPWLASFIVANIAGFAADRMMRAGYSATVVRKLMNTLGLGLGGILLCQAPAASSFTVAVVLMCCATAAFAACYAGFAPNSLDIAPDYADVLAGLSNTAATLPGVVGVFATGWLVDHTGSFRVPFFVTGGISLFGALFFLIFASGERQIHEPP